MVLFEAGFALHLFERLGDEGCDLVGLLTTVGVGLIEIEIRQREAAQRRLAVVACVEADGAV